MKIIEVEERTPALVGQLVAVWEQSVRATHLFLSDEEIKKIKAYVPDAICEVERLVILQNAAGEPVAFLGVAGETLEMLFLAPEQRGKGWGKRLLLYGTERLGIKALTVNEQNPQARGFYEHMGFQVYRRTEQDEQGNPYPLLYMSR